MDGFRRLAAQRETDAEVGAGIMPRLVPAEQGLEKALGIGGKSGDGIRHGHRHGFSLMAETDSQYAGKRAVGDRVVEKVVDDDADERGVRQGERR